MNEYLFDLAAAQQKAREMEIVFDTMEDIAVVTSRPNPRPINGHDAEWTPDQLAQATGRHRTWIDLALEDLVSQGKMVRWIGPGSIGNTFIPNTFQKK